MEKSGQKQHKLTRRQRDDLRKKGEILSAALEIFAARGFHSTTMAQISKVSQYPLGTIYKYFPGKKEMYYDLVINRVRELGGILSGIRMDKTLSLSQKLKACLKAQADFYKKNQEVVKIYISERATIDAVTLPKLNLKLKSFHEKMIALFQDLFDQGIEAGEFKAFPSREMAELYADIVHSAAWNASFRDEDESRTDRRISMIFDMFFNGIISNPT